MGSSRCDQESFGQRWEPSPCPLPWLRERVLNMILLIMLITRPTWSRITAVLPPRPQVAEISTIILLLTLLALREGED